MLEVAKLLAVNYCLIVGEINDVDQGNIQTYGIEARNESGEFLCKIVDISTEKAVMEKFVAAVNEYGLSIHHFEDAVEDFLANL